MQLLAHNETGAVEVMDCIINKADDKNNINMTKLTYQPLTSLTESTCFSGAGRELNSDIMLANLTGNSFLRNMNEVFGQAL